MGSNKKDEAYSQSDSLYGETRSFRNGLKYPKDNDGYAHIRITIEASYLPFYYWTKNFVLMSSDHGAKASAMLYSLVETAKANELNTYQYMELLVTEIPKHMDDKDHSFINDILLWSPAVQESCPSKYKKS